MSETAEQLLKKAMTLSEQDRASLAGALVESLYVEREPGAEAAWDAEIGRRVLELEAHAVETVPWPAVKKQLFHGFE